MVVAKRYLLVVACGLVTSAPPILLNPSMAQADCCIYPKPAASIQKPEDCCVFSVSPKGGKSFEGRIMEVDKDAGVLVIEGAAIRKGATFTVEPREKIREFRKGEEVKGTLMDSKTMKFDYEFLRR